MRTIDKNRTEREEVDALFADLVAQCDEYEARTESTAPALIRLARQLDLSESRLERKLLDLAIREVDWNLSQGCAPFDCCADSEDIDLTVALAALSPHEIAALEMDGEYAQRTIYTRAMTALGKRCY